MIRIREFRFRFRFRGLAMIECRVQIECRAPSDLTDLCLLKQNRAGRIHHFVTCASRASSILVVMVVVAVDSLGRRVDVVFSRSLFYKNSKL